MDKKYLIFQTYPSQGQADEVAQLLLKAGIDNIVVEESGGLDSNFMGTRFDDRFSLKIEGPNFERARNTILESVEINLDEVDKEYMLLHFTDVELLEVVAKPDEWGAYNYQLARMLLAKRGVKDNASVDFIQDKHIKTLSQQSKLGIIPILISLGFTALTIAIMLDIDLVFITNWLRPGFFLVNVLFCAAIVYLKKTLPDGKRVFAFDNVSRKTGKILFALSLSTLTALYVYFIYRSMPLI